VTLTEAERIRASYVPGRAWLHLVAVQATGLLTELFQVSLLNELSSITKVGLYTYDMLKVHLLK